jgi:hypothetical protein
MQAPSEFRNWFRAYVKCDPDRSLAAVPRDSLAAPAGPLDGNLGAPQLRVWGPCLAGRLESIALRNHSIAVE